MNISAVPVVGDTITVTFGFTSNITDSVNIGIRFSSAIKPLGWSGDDFEDLNTTFVEEDSVYSIDFEMEVLDEGYTLFELIGKTRVPLTSHNDYVKKCQLVRSGINDGNIFLKLDPDDDVARMTFDEVINDTLGGTGGTTNIKVSGNIYYHDDQGNTNIYADKTTSGDELPTFPEVRIWFHDATKIVNDEEYYDLIHPVALQSNSYIEGTHYAFCDENGDYEFDFNMSGSIPDNTYEIWVFPCKENKELILESPTDHFNVNMTSPLTNQDERILFFQSDACYKSGLIGSVSSIDYSDIDLKLPSQDGALLRYVQLANKHWNDRYDNYLPFFSLGKLRRIEGTVKRGPGSARWSIQTNIRFDPVEARKRVVYHEFTHCIHGYMANNNSEFYGIGKFQEGIADFGSEITDQWGSNYDDDEIYQISFSSEQSPFLYTNDTLPIRFANLPHYGYHDDEETIENYKKTQFHCYLYNFYDSYDEGDFTGTNYEGKENDDVSDIVEELFDYLHYISDPLNDLDDEYRESMDESSSLFHSGFKTFLNDSDLGLSLDKIKDFIYDDDQEDPPPMKSAQVGPHSSGSIHYADPGLSLRWASRSYSNSTYNNLETGYKVYSWNGSTSSWDYEATYNNSTFLHTISSSCVCPNCPSGTWKVTAYNEEGESYDPLSRTFTCEGLDKKALFDDAKILSQLKLKNVFPNPANSYCNIIFTVPPNSNVSITLSTIEGKPLITDHFKSDSNIEITRKIEFPKNLITGTYYIQFIVLADNGIIHRDTREVIVK